MTEYTETSERERELERLLGLALDDYFAGEKWVRAAARLLGREVVSDDLVAAEQLATEQAMDRVRACVTSTMEAISGDDYRLPVAEAAERVYQMGAERDSLKSQLAERTAEVTKAWQIIESVRSSLDKGGHAGKSHDLWLALEALQPTKPKENET